MPILTIACIFAESPIGFKQVSTELLFLTISLTAFLLANAYQNLSHKELIFKCCRRSKDWEDIWQEFKNRFDKLILLFIYREFKQRSGKKYGSQFNDIIKDLRQDVYIKLLNDKGKALRNFKGKDENSFLAYLYTISKNLVINYVKSSHKREVHLRDVKSHQNHLGFDNYQPEPLTSNTSDELEEHFLQELLVEKLKENYSSRKFERDLVIFKLFYFKGLSPQDIQRNFDFNLSASGIETLVSRMKKTLKQCIS